MNREYCSKNLLTSSIKRKAPGRVSKIFTDSIPSTTAIVLLPISLYPSPKNQVFLFPSPLTPPTQSDISREKQKAQLWK